MTTDKPKNLKKETTPLNKSIASASENFILQTQKGFNIDKTVRGIMNGSIQMLTAEDIARKLNISVELFHKWVSNGNPKYKKSQNSYSSLVDALRQYGQPPIVKAFYEMDEEKNTFPSPDFYLGNHPRWLDETLKNWLYAQIRKAD